MDVVLQTHCAKHIYVVPEGLRELMSDISREVIRSQPENIYTFITDYLDALMITRENARVAAKLVQALTETSKNIAEFLTRTNMTREQADNVVIVIQKAFRKHLEEQAKNEEIVDESVIIKAIMEEADITKAQGDMAACIVQNAFRKFQENKKKERQMGYAVLDWRVAARSAIMLYRRTGVTPEEANRAATLIQAAYKGYYTKKLKKMLLERSQELEESTDEDKYSRASDKKVRIDYSSVIPHVDFDESTEDINLIIVQCILEDILKKVLEEDKSDARELKEFVMEENNGEDKFNESASQRQSLESFILKLLMERTSPITTIFDEQIVGDDQEIMEYENKGLNENLISAEYEQTTENESPIHPIFEDDITVNNEMEYYCKKSKKSL